MTRNKFVVLIENALLSRKPRSQLRVTNVPGGHGRSLGERHLDSMTDNFSS